jgi:ABC-type nitrate/sulfonate/bicarbonate transport system substrate-binding protein
MASEKLIAEHPDLVRAYVSAISEAADWANAHPAEVIQLGLDKGRLDPQYLPANHRQRSTVTSRRSSASRRNAALRLKAQSTSFRMRGSARSVRRRNSADAARPCQNCSPC